MMGCMKNQVQEIISTLPHVGPESVFLIAVDGCGGAGKSMFANELASALSDSQLVHVDDFYKPKNERIEITDETPVHSNFEFDKLKQQVLEPLKHGSVAKYKTPSGRTIEIKPIGYVIVEGLGTLGTELRGYFDYKIWIDALKTVRRQRGIERDGKDWATIWDMQYLPQDARYVREQSPQKEADWIVSNGKVN